jgi:hypothetical protein
MIDDDELKDLAEYFLSAIGDDKATLSQAVAG